MEQILGSEKIDLRVTNSVTVRGPCKKINHLSRSYEIEKL